MELLITVAAAVTEVIFLGQDTPVARSARMRESGLPANLSNELELSHTQLSCQRSIM